MTNERLDELLHLRANIDSLTDKKTDFAYHVENYYAKLMTKEEVAQIITLFNYFIDKRLEELQMEFDEA